ncbi:transposase [Bradyrhizobium sp. CNPSo 4010]|uniref:Transposase n=1 Tax=Bradyrhizobium agreste TaxID=2751811 RepID=A0ABS0PGG4_9BRAD|nr:transposase [Bradyrhizobium agreste]
MLWIACTGCPWRDLPAARGDWNSVFRDLTQWSVKGVFGGECSRRCPTIRTSNNRSSIPR